MQQLSCRLGGSEAMCFPMYAPLAGLNIGEGTCQLTEVYCSETGILFQFCAPLAVMGAITSVGRTYLKRITFYHISG